MWSMACVQGTWWGVGREGTGGWWGSWLWCRVSGWGWVVRLGVSGGWRCLSGGSRFLGGEGGGVVCWGLFP
nr:MAG TPA: hypothetical protein [Caudoviricetes sp.]